MSSQINPLLKAPLLPVPEDKVCESEYEKFSTVKKIVRVLAAILPFIVMGALALGALVLELVSIGSIKLTEPLANITRNIFNWGTSTYVIRNSTVSIDTDSEEAQ